jgi:uncharacterized protein with HEPN domain
MIPRAPGGCFFDHSEPKWNSFSKQEITLSNLIRMKTNEEDLIRLSDIADAMREIQGYVGQNDYGEFSMREDMQAAVISQMQQIGGAAALLSDEFKEKYRDIDWDVLRGLQYGNFDQQYEMELLPHWYIITNDFPELLGRISDLATELQDAVDQEDEIMLDDTDQTEAEVEAKVETEDYLNQRIGEDQLVGDLETENDVVRSERDKHFPKEFIEEIEIEGLNAQERKILLEINREVSANKEGDIELESLEEMSLSEVDRADDSFIDQRFEDVDLMADSSLDDDVYGSDDDESLRERG